MGKKLITDRGIMDNIIQGSQICHLACCLDDHPYVIPLSFGYDGHSIFIHTAQKGKKIEIFTRNQRVCLAFENNIDLKHDPEQACEWSFAYTSIIAEGSIQELTSETDKKSSLDQIIRHYSDQNWEIPSAELKKTRVWKISLETMTGKRSPSE
jgi:nitroimidazol reductase NimA-like FMN-containing flavoprotein (pyridoxamine 5'-phosphate oxidase superfamily)